MAGEFDFEQIECLLQKGYKQDDPNILSPNTSANKNDLIVSQTATGLQSDGGANRDVDVEDEHPTLTYKPNEQFTPRRRSIDRSGSSTSLSNIKSRTYERRNDDQLGDRVERRERLSSDDYRYDTAENKHDRHSHRRDGGPRRRSRSGVRHGDADEETRYRGRSNTSQQRHGDESRRRDPYHHDASRRQDSRREGRNKVSQRNRSLSRSRSRPQGTSVSPDARLKPNSLSSHSNQSHPLGLNKRQPPDVNHKVEGKPRSDDDRRQRELDEARRDDQTVLVMNLNLKASERDVWKWFSERAGKVRDIQIIRDSRSGKSKGVGYVEFFTQEAVIKALALTGQLLDGQAIRVQASQAEKNRAAKLAKQQAAEAADGGPMKVYVGGLSETLSNINADELRQLFAPFGDIVNVDIHYDPYTGKCKGFAFVQFAKAADAREAMAAMNGFEIAGRAIRVGFATESGGTNALYPLSAVGADGALSQLGGQAHTSNFATLAQIAAAQAAASLVEETPDSERLDDEGGGLMCGASVRLALMQKLQRSEQGSLSGNPSHFGSGAQAAATTHKAVPFTAPSTVADSTATANVVLFNMFSPTEALEEGEGFFDEVVDDVRSECSKFGAILQVYVNRKNPNGKVYIKFAATTAAVQAFQRLNGRYFSGHEVKASFITDSAWSLEVASG